MLNLDRSKYRRNLGRLSSSFRKRTLKLNGKIAFITNVYVSAFVFYAQSKREIVT